MHKSLHVRLLAFAFDEEVEMVGHEAVRNHGNVEKRCGVHNVPEHGVDNSWFDEQTIPVMCAEREEIASQADVQRSVQTRTWLRHGPTTCKLQTGAALKGCATDAVRQR